MLVASLGDFFPAFSPLFFCLDDIKTSVRFDRDHFLYSLGGSLALASEHESNYCCTDLLEVMFSVSS